MPVVDLTFTLEGERLKGKWHLVRTRGKPGQKNEQWLLLKSDDESRPGRLTIPTSWRRKRLR